MEKALKLWNSSIQRKRSCSPNTYAHVNMPAKLPNRSHTPRMEDKLDTRSKQTRKLDDTANGKSSWTKDCENDKQKTLAKYRMEKVEKQNLSYAQRERAAIRERRRHIDQTDRATIIKLLRREHEKLSRSDVFNTGVLKASQISTNTTRTQYISRTTNKENYKNSASKRSRCPEWAEQSHSNKRCVRRVIFPAIDVSKTQITDSRVSKTPERQSLSPISVSSSPPRKHSVNVRRNKKKIVKGTSLWKKIVLKQHYRAAELYRKQCSIC